jgi:hypothetical protein
VAKVKVINNNLDQNLNGNTFTNVPSETIFSFGKFSITSNFDGRKYINYSDTLSSFVRPVTLENIGISDVESEIIYQYNTNAVLNLDKSDLNTFIRFGSAYEFLRVCIENIILTYPGSIFMNSQLSRNNNITYFDYIYDPVSNSSTFKIPMNCVMNTFGLVYNYGNNSIPDNNELKNLNFSYENYVVWTSMNPDDNTSNVIGFTGNTTGRNYLTLTVHGNPFSMITTDSAPLDFHIKPNNYVFEKFRAVLNEFEKYIVSSRVGMNGFEFVLKDPTLLDDGNITYSDIKLLWNTSDKYNIDINTPNYQKFLEIVLTVGVKYDKIKTDLIARFLTPSSIKAYDLTDEGKMTKLLRIYGREFDQIREFIDSLVYINKVTYDKVNNVPDQVVRNLSRTFGWDYFSLVNETELIESFLTVDENERDLNSDLLPAEIDIELWRRIIMNTNYFWKSKGTREAIKSMFLLIGIPEPFINITEYVYTVDGKINPNTVPFSINDFPTQSLPYDTEGYPKAPIEGNNYYFQISGDTDNGQTYFDLFRKVGFNLMRTPDNKKSWVESGATYRIDDSTPQYYQLDSKLVLNTKEVDVALDTARGIEYDVYNYIQKDYAINSSGYTLPYSYVNISLGVSGSQNTFPLPLNYSSEKVMGDLEVRFNGILLNAPKTGTTTGITYQADYSIDEVSKTFTILNGIYAKNNTLRRDVIQATFIYSGGTHSLSGLSVNYVVTRVKADVNGTVIPLPTYPRGDVQVTINGIALTKGTPQFIADYTLDPNNSTGSTNNQIIIQNPEVIAYLQINPEIQIAYVEVEGSNDIYARSEIVRVDSFNSSKIYLNQSANKYVYRLNYKANNASDIKVLIDGIALEPNTDYSINVQNLYEVFLPRGIKYGSVISVYYLVGANALFNPVISDVFGIGDISNLSFLEFIDLIQKRLVNSRNRKTISDFKGGWYPTLLRVYTEYLKRATLPEDNPLHSNGYTFANLYPFLSKYNAFFQRFVDQLLSATIILRRGGLMVRNSVFTKQKFMYRRGVNLYANNSTTTDKRGNPMYEYLGDDDVIFKIVQDILPPEPPNPPTLYVDTITGGIGSIITGGENILGIEVINKYGVDYRKWNGSSWDTWVRISESGTLISDSYSTTISDVTPDTMYEYRAFVQSPYTGYTGQSKTITTPVVVPDPEIFTKNASVTQTTLASGGENIVRYADADYYGMQYRVLYTSTWTTVPAPLLSTPLVTNNYDYLITGLSPETAYEYRAYMTVDGVPYYGNTKTTVTSAIAPTIPTVITGGAHDVTDICMQIGDNYVSDKGNACITEYGVLYTQNPAYSCASCLVYGNTPTYVCKKSISSDIGVGTCYFPDGVQSIINLDPNTQTYYRAYATNSVGVGYGCVNSQATCVSSTVHTVYLSDGNYNSCSISAVNSCAKIVIEPPLTPGQSFTLSYSNNACSTTDTVTRLMSTCSFVCCGINKLDCASTNIPDNYSACSCDVSDNKVGTINIDYATNLSDITFYTIANSHTSNACLDYNNCASTCITSISNPVNGTFQISGDLNNQYMCIYTASNFTGNESGGFVPFEIA